MRFWQVGGQEDVKESKLVCLTLSCLPTFRQLAFQTVVLFVYLMKSLLLRKHVLGDKLEMVAYIWWQTFPDVQHHWSEALLCSQDAPGQPHALQMVYIVSLTAALFLY